MHPGDRHKRGLEAIAKIDPNQIVRMIGGLQDIAPDFAEHIVDFAFGDIYARPGLDPRARQIATMAALIAMGTAQPQLKAHIEIALKVGITRAEIVEVIMQMAVYAGFPAALNGFAAAKEVFAVSPNPSPVAPARDIAHNQPRNSSFSPCAK